MKALLLIALILSTLFCQGQSVKKHWHSWSLNKELNENVKDSAYKYWKLDLLYQDSANTYQKPYYQKKADMYRRLSIHYKEKQ
jgi:hypothetical protein